MPPHRMISHSAQIVSPTPSLTISTPARWSAFNYDARGDSLRQQFQISALPGRLHISNRGARAAAVSNVGVEPAKTLGDIGIEVADRREPRFASGREERIAERQIELRGLDHHRAAAPVPFIGASRIGFGSLEVGQRLLEGPPMAPELRPLVVIRASGLGDKACR